jgi:Icc-related predicted phosphoesterase
LLEAVEAGRPDAVFVAGDLLSHDQARTLNGVDFIADWLAPRCAALRHAMGDDYPDWFVILGNDDGRLVEPSVRAGESERLWRYIHGRVVSWGVWSVVGYSFVPPTPFALKDWERYDVSRYTDPGCVSPEEGQRTVACDPDQVRWTTIEADLDRLGQTLRPERTIWLFHTPPYRTSLDRAALDGRTIEHVPLDVNVGSIAVRRMIESRQPHLTLHGHVHESARLTGRWRDRIGTTHLLSAAHDGRELALVRFDVTDPANATRDLLQPSE